MKSVSEARARVDTEVRAIIEWVEANDCGTAAVFEAELWKRVITLGAVLFGLFLCCRASRPRAARYEVDGRSYVLSKGGRKGLARTMFGQVAFWEPMAERVGRSNKRDFPLSRELRMEASFTLGVMSTVAELCARMPFASARAIFKKFCGWVPSPRSVLRFVDALGGKAKAFIDQLPAPAGDGELLFIEVDGGAAPMISPTEHQRRCRPRRARERTERATVRARRRENPKPRRTSGKKSKNGKVAVVGVIYTLKRTPHGLEGPINKRVIGTFESHEALFQWLLPEAKKRGYGRKKTVFIADGCEHIWRLQQRYFSEAIPCIDFWHIAEKLWEAGTLLFKDDSDGLRDWYARHKGMLRAGKASEIIDMLGTRIAAIAKTGPRNKWRRERLIEIQKHFAENEGRMKYDQLRRHDLPIGSGAVEGAVRNLIRVRLDGPGMRWGRGRSEWVLHLRCILLNEQWDEFKAFLDRDSVTLSSTPALAVPYDAKAAA